MGLHNSEPKHGNNPFPRRILLGKFGYIFCVACRVVILHDLSLLLAEYVGLDDELLVAMACSLLKVSLPELRAVAQEGR